MRKFTTLAAIILFSIYSFAEMRVSPEITQERIDELSKNQTRGKASGELILVVFRDFWHAKVKESNYSTLRPGSIYDLVVLFEQKFGLPRPLFNYFFTDTGLGVAEPLYPVFQQGYQTSWAQLIGSSFGDDARHIDHYSSMITPEGCRSESSYWIRSIKDFPQYKAEMDQGYTLVDISFEYTTKLRSDAQCGRHHAHEPSDFEPNEYMKQFADKYRSPADIPAKMLAKYEYKVNVLKLVSRDTKASNWPRYRNEYSMRANSLWYYPDAHAKDFGINTPRPQPGLQHYNLPGDNIIPINPELRLQLGFDRFVSPADFVKAQNFLRGKPVAGFNPRLEPGQDTLNINEVTAKNIYTHGLELEPIRNALADTANTANFALISAVVKPRESVTDKAWKGTRTIPQLRLVFQMMNPYDNRRPTEQLYFHATYDAVDRYASDAERAKQAADFMAEMDRLTAVRRGGQGADASIRTFIDMYTSRPLTSLNFSSSLTGIWVFGSMSREFNQQRELVPVKIVRNGIDVGYYSTLFDNQVFRDAAAKATGARKTALEDHLKTLSPVFYRDPRRMDVAKINFNKVTCAQCHQMSGRDGIHVSLNDGLDRRKTGSILPTEFLYRDLDVQMKAGVSKGK